MYRLEIEGNNKKALEEFETIKEAQDRMEELRNDKWFLNDFGHNERWLKEPLDNVETREVPNSFEIGEVETVTEYLHPAEYTYEIIDITEEHNKEKQKQELLKKGKIARDRCQTAIDYIGGYNQTRELTTEQITSLISTFSQIDLFLYKCMPTSAKNAIQQIEVDGMLITQELVDGVLEILEH